MIKTNNSQLTNEEYLYIMKYVTNKYPEYLKYPDEKLLLPALLNRISKDVYSLKESITKQYHLFCSVVATYGMHKAITIFDKSNYCFDGGIYHYTNSDIKYLAMKKLDLSNHYQGIGKMPLRIYKKCLDMYDDNELAMIAEFYRHGKVSFDFSKKIYNIYMIYDLIHSIIRSNKNNRSQVQEIIFQLSYDEMRLLYDFKYVNLCFRQNDIFQTMSLDGIVPSLSIEQLRNLLTYDPEYISRFYNESSWIKTYYRIVE